MENLSEHLLLPLLLLLLSPYLCSLAAVSLEFTIDKHVASAESYLAGLEKATGQKRVAEAAKLLIAELKAAVLTLKGIGCDFGLKVAEPEAPAYSIPSGWTMYEFLTSEGKKFIQKLNAHNFATNETKSQTLFFEDPIKDSRWVCVACFRGKRRPAACVFRNRLGAQGHRARKVLEQMSANPAWHQPRWFPTRRSP